MSNAQEKAWNSGWDTGRNCFGVKGKTQAGLSWVVCEISNYTNTGVTHKIDAKEREEAARLIAAAPDLLEALELAVTMLNDVYNPLNRQHSPTFKTLQAAIARAKGV